MTEIRCVKCNRLLMKSNGNGSKGLVLEVKCPKCGFIHSYSLGEFSIDELLDKDRLMIAEVNKGITILSVR